MTSCLVTWTTKPFQTGVYWGASSFPEEPILIKNGRKSAELLPLKVCLFAVKVG